MPFQPAGLLYPDAASEVATWLAAQTELSGIPVVTDLTGWDSATTIVRIRRLGGQIIDMTDRAWLQVDTWASLSDTAHDLAQIVRGLILGSPGLLPGVTAARDMVGPRSLTDLEPEHPRWAFDVEVQMRSVSTLR